MITLIYSKYPPILRTYRKTPSADCTHLTSVGPHGDDDCTYNAIPRRGINGGARRASMDSILRQNIATRFRTPHLTPNQNVKQVPSSFKVPYPDEHPEGRTTTPSNQELSAAHQIIPQGPQFRYNGPLPYILPVQSSKQSSRLSSF